MRSDEPGFGGDLVQANTRNTVSEILRRMRTLGDIDVDRPVWGYDLDNDVKIFNAQAEYDDDVLMRGGIFLAKKFRGTSRFSTVFGVRGGRSSYDDNSAFRSQVASVSSVQQLSLYGLHDGVGDFGDATLPALESWETVNSATYSATSVTVDAATYSDLLNNIRRGDVIKTRHATKIWGVVDSADKTTGVITVAGWAVAGASVVPANDGSGFYINLIDKIWAFNRNAIIPPDAAGLYAVVGELGVQIKKLGMGYVNGLDTVLVKGSIANGTAAYLARSGQDGFGWLYGFDSQGARFNFYSTTGKLQPYAGFMENSDAIVGMKFSNKNTYSMAWITSDDLTQTGLTYTPTIIGALGRVYRQPERILNISADGSVHPLYPTVYVTAAGVTITLPDTSQLPVSGYLHKLIFFNSGTYTIKAYNNQTTVNGYSTFIFTITLTPAQPRYRLNIQWDGTYWQAY